MAPRAEKAAYLRLLAGLPARPRAAPMSTSDDSDDSERRLSAISPDWDDGKWWSAGSGVSRRLVSLAVLGAARAPLPGDTCRLRIRGYKRPLNWSDSVVDATAIDITTWQLFDAVDGLEIVLGRDMLVSGLERGVLTLTEGATADFILEPSVAFGEIGYPEKGVPGDATVGFRVTLDELHFVDDYGESSGVGSSVGSRVATHEQTQLNNHASFLAAAYATKAAGNKSFEEGRPDVALGEFRRSLALAALWLEFGTGSEEKRSGRHGDSSDDDDIYKDENEDENVCLSLATRSHGAHRTTESAADPQVNLRGSIDKDETSGAEVPSAVLALVEACILNAARCHLELSQWAEAERLCLEVLASNPNHEKARFRLGRALAGFKEFDGAREQFRKVLQINPNSVAAQNQLGLVDIAEHDEFRAEQLRTLRRMRASRSKVRGGWWDHFMADVVQPGISRQHLNTLSLVVGLIVLCSLMVFVLDGNIHALYFMLLAIALILVMQWFAMNLPEEALLEDYVATEYQRKNS